MERASDNTSKAAGVVRELDVDHMSPTINVLRATHGVGTGELVPERLVGSHDDVGLAPRSGAHRRDEGAVARQLAVLLRRELEVPVGRDQFCLVLQQDTACA